MSNRLLSARRGAATDPAIAATDALMMDLAREDGASERACAMLEGHLQSGGKRIRARLALDILHTLGGDRDLGVPWGAACELLHHATLVHDDIQDGDRLRRGRPTTWALHGIPQAINAGDLLHALAHRAIARLQVPPEIRWTLSDALARHAAAAVRGQSLEMDLLLTGRTDWESWRKAAAGKTGALLALPVEGAAILAGRSPGDAARIAAPFGHIGVLFQIEDDLLDVYDAEGRGAPGNDLREGKVSALIVEHLARVPADRAWLLTVLQLPREQTPRELVEEALRRFRAGGALDTLRDRMAAISQEITTQTAWSDAPGVAAVAHALMEIAYRAIDAARQDMGRVATTPDLSRR